MSKAGYLCDIFARGFFIFIVGQLLLRNFFWSLFLTIGINLIYELTAGRKFWQAWKKQPKKPHRSWRQIALSLWRRAFSRERTKSLVWAGVVILSLSYVVRLQVYYIVVACIVFTMAAITRFAPPPKSGTITHEPAHDENIRPTNCAPNATK